MLSLDKLLRSSETNIQQEEEINYVKFPTKNLVSNIYSHSYPHTKRWQKRVPFALTNNPTMGSYLQKELASGAFLGCQRESA